MRIEKVCRIIEAFLLSLSPSRRTSVGSGAAIAGAAIGVAGVTRHPGGTKRRFHIAFSG